MYNSFSGRTLVTAGRQLISRFFDCVLFYSRSSIQEVSTWTWWLLRKMGFKPLIPHLIPRKPSLLNSDTYGLLNQLQTPGVFQVSVLIPPLYPSERKKFSKILCTFKKHRENKPKNFLIKTKRFWCYWNVKNGSNWPKQRLPLHKWPNPAGRRLSCT